MDMDTRKSGQGRAHRIGQGLAGDRPSALDEQVQLFGLATPAAGEDADAVAFQRLLDRPLPRLGGKLAAPDMDDVGRAAIEGEAPGSVEHAEIAGIEPAVREEPG